MCDVILNGSVGCGGEMMERKNRCCITGIVRTEMSPQRAALSFLHGLLKAKLLFDQSAKAFFDFRMAGNRSFLTVLWVDEQIVTPPMAQ